MRTWKDKTIYQYPFCQSLILQQSEGKRFRLKLIATEDQCTGSRYNNDGRIVECDHSFVTKQPLALRVAVVKGIKLRNQFRDLNHCDWRIRIPMFNKGVDLLEVANHCKMTPLGPIIKLQS